MERRLTALETFFATASCSTKHDSPQFDRVHIRAGSAKSQDREADAGEHELRDEDESYPSSIGNCSDADSESLDADPDDHNRFLTYKEVCAYVASASTNDAHAPLHECLEVKAVNPVNGATRKAIVFFDSGSTFSYASPTLARDLDLPLHGKCVLRVNTFGSPAPTTVEGFSTSVVLCSSQGRQVSLGATTAELAIPSVRTALVEDADLPLLRRNERILFPTEVSPDILIGQDRIQLFGRQTGLRLSSGYNVVHTILGPTIGGAAQVVNTTPKADPSSDVTSAAEASGQHLGPPQSQPSDIADASLLQTIALSPPAPSNHETLPRQALKLPSWQLTSAISSEREPPTSHSAPAISVDEDLSVPPLKADHHPCLQNQLQGVTTSTTLRAVRHSLPERNERSELLRRKRNPLDTARPSQSGLHTTYAVLQPELLGHQTSAECVQQQERALRVTAEQVSAIITTMEFTSSRRCHELGQHRTSAHDQHILTTHQELHHQLQQTTFMLPRHPPQLKLDLPTRPVEAAPRLSTSSRPASPSEHTRYHRTMADETSNAPSEPRDGRSSAAPTRNHPHQRRDATESTQSINRATTAPSARLTKPTASGTDLLSGPSSAATQPASMSQTPAALKKSAASGPDLLSGLQDTAAETTTAPKQPAPQENKKAAATRGPQEPATAGATATAQGSGPQEPATAAATTSQHATHCASDTVLLTGPDSAVANAPIASNLKFHQQQPSTLGTVLLTGTNHTARAADTTTPHHPANQKSPFASGTVLLAGSDSKTNQVSLVPAARADPLDQEEKSDPTNIRCAPAEAPTSVNQMTTGRRRPGEAAMDHTTPSEARHTTPEGPATSPQPSIAYHAAAEAARHRTASSQDDDVRLCRINRDGSPLKNETVCFCDASTFRYFSRLLRPEVRMIPTPVPSLEDALRSVSNIHPTKEVRRVIFWFSDSHTTQLNTAVQLRLVIELSRHYATRYPTVMQYVVANPFVGSRQDIWTCGLFKLLVQMQMTLPSARLIMRPRNSRSVTRADVAALKCFLRDHYHLNLWSRYDAGVPQSKVPYPPPRSQQRHTTRATSSTEPAAAVAPC
ncbi:Pao retrotransposon peptidase family protein, partial [Aphelenchoides avenae]